MQQPTTESAGSPQIIQIEMQINPEESQSSD